MTDLWQPRSACGSDCLPAPRPAHLAGTLRVLRRLAATAVVVLVGGFGAAAAGRAAGAALLAVQRVFARTVLRTLGIRHRVLGRVPERRALLVANHVSWIDTLVVLADTPARMLAKQEVRDWPIIGRLARPLGTVFVDRARPRALPATVAPGRRRARRRRGGGRVPGGYDLVRADRRPLPAGDVPGRHRRRGPVVPVRLSFSIDGEPTTVVAFLGEDTLYASVRRVVAIRGLTVTLRTAPDAPPDARRRRGGRRAGPSRPAAGSVLLRPAPLFATASPK